MATNAELECQLREVRIPREVHACVDDLVNELKLEMLKLASQRATRRFGSGDRLRVTPDDVVHVAGDIFSAALEKLELAFAELRTNTIDTVAADNVRKKAS